MLFGSTTQGWLHLLYVKLILWDSQANSFQELAILLGTIISKGHINFLVILFQGNLLFWHSHRVRNKDNHSSYLHWQCLFCFEIQNAENIQYSLTRATSRLPRLIRLRLMKHICFSYLISPYLEIIQYNYDKFDHFDGLQSIEVSS